MAIPLNLVSGWSRRYAHAFGRFSLFALISVFAPHSIVHAQEPTKNLPGTVAEATFAGGCFWCVEEAFDAVEGVISTVSGYMGGHIENPSYQQVSAGQSGHREVVRIVYNPSKVSYAKLLDAFWQNVDPTQSNGQFCDRGLQYRSEIFFHDEIQRNAAETSLKQLMASKPFSGKIQTVITPAAVFYPAEEYHQGYYLKNPVRYKYYKTGCGRAAQLREVWKTD